MVERVRPTKHEYAAHGGDANDENEVIADINTAEDFLDCRGITIQTETTDDEAVRITRDSDNIATLLDTGHSTASPITTTYRHKLLDTLQHEIVENHFYEPTYASSKITAETWWTNDSKTTKIKEILYTYTGSKVSTETWHQFNSAGTQIATLLLSYTYSGSKITSVIGSYSEP